MAAHVTRALRTFHTLQWVPSGDAGVSTTLKEMAKIARAWSKHPQIRSLAVRLVGSCPSEAWKCEIHKLHDYVRDRIRYVGDVLDVETLQTPELTLKQRAGDCDDQSILLASLLLSIGHPVRFVAVAFDRGAFSHVFTETRLGGYWIAAETIKPVGLGWRPPGIKRHMIRTV